MAQDPLLKTVSLVLSFTLTLVSCAKIIYICLWISHAQEETPSDIIAVIWILTGAIIFIPTIVIIFSVYAAILDSFNPTFMFGHRSCTTHLAIWISSIALLFTPFYFLGQNELYINEVHRIFGYYAQWEPLIYYSICAIIALIIATLWYGIYTCIFCTCKRNTHKHASTQIMYFQV